MFGFSKPSQSAATKGGSAQTEPPSVASGLGLHAGLSTALSFSFANSLPPTQDSHETEGSSRRAANEKGGRDTPQEAELQRQAGAHLSQAHAAAAAPAVGHLLQSLLPGSELDIEAAGAVQTHHQCSTEPRPVQEGASAAALEPAGAAVMEQGGSSTAVPTCLSEAAELGLGEEPAGQAAVAAGQAMPSAQLSSAEECGPLAGSILPFPEAAGLPQEATRTSSLAASAGAAAPQGPALQGASEPEAAGSMHQIPGASPAEAGRQHQLPSPDRGVAEPDPQPDMQTLVAGQSYQEQVAGLIPAPQADMPTLAAGAQQQAGAHSLSPLEPGQGEAGPAQQSLSAGQGTAEQPAVSLGQGVAGQRPEMEALAAGLFSLDWAFGFTPPPQQPAWQVDTDALASVPAQVARFEAWSQRQGPAGPDGGAALLGEPAGQLTGSLMGHPAPVAASRMPGELSAAQTGRQAAAVDQAGQAAAVAGGGHGRLPPAAVSTTAIQEVDSAASAAAAEAAGLRQAAQGEPSNNEATSGTGRAEPSLFSRGGVAGGLGSASTAVAQAANPAQFSRDGNPVVTGSRTVGVGSHQQQQAAELLPAGSFSAAEAAAASAPQTAVQLHSNRSAAAAADTDSYAAAADPGAEAAQPPLRGSDDRGTTARNAQPHLAQPRPAVGPAAGPEGHMQPPWTDHPTASQRHAGMAAAEQQAVDRQAAEAADVGVEQGPGGSEEQMPPPTATAPVPARSGGARRSPAGSGARTLPSTARELSLATEEGPWRLAAPRPWQNAPAYSGQDHASAAGEGSRQQVPALPWPAEQGQPAAAGERPRSALRLIDETLRDLDRAGASGGGSPAWVC